MHAYMHVCNHACRHARSTGSHAGMHASACLHAGVWMVTLLSSASEVELEPGAESSVRMFAISGDTLGSGGGRSANELKSTKFKEHCAWCIVSVSGT